MIRFFRDTVNGFGYSIQHKGSAAFASFIIVGLLLLSTISPSLSFSQGDWCFKIGNYTISPQMVRTAFETYIDLQVMLTGGDSMYNQSQISQMKNDRDQLKEYAQMYLGETLIMVKAKEMSLYDAKAIKSKSLAFAKFFYRQLILKEYADQLVRPKVSISANEIQKGIQMAEERYGDQISKMNAGDKQEFIKGQLMALKILDKLYEDVDKFKMELQIFSQDCELGSGSWCYKINNYEISASMIRAMYETFIDLQVMMSGGDSMYAQDEINRLKQDSDKFNEYAQTFLGETLIMIKSKEKGIYNAKKLEEKSLQFAQFFFRQLVLKEFANKVVRPKVSVQQTELQQGLKQVKEAYPDIANLPADKQSELVRSQIEAQKTLQRMMEMVDQYKLEYTIRSNDCF